MENGGASVGRARWALRQALLLQPGASMIIPCADKSEMESMRTLMFMERKKYSQVDSQIDAKVRISRWNKESSFGVQVTRRNEMAEEVIIIEADGSVRTMKVLAIPRDSILERLSDMMSSGVTIDQIDNGKDGYFLPELFKNRGEIESAIEWARQEIGEGRKIIFDWKDEYK